MSDLLSLADRVEEATGADRRLFCEIIESLATKISYGEQARFLRFVEAEAWLDAAALLVPKGTRFYADNGTLDGGTCHACVWQVEPNRMSGGSRDATMPALALVAAALRARAAQGKG